MPTEPDFNPRLIYPEFYNDPHVRAMGHHRLWTVSTNRKIPVDIVALSDTGPRCPRCFTENCQIIHGAQISEARSQLMTLPELTDALPTAANATVHLDSQLTGTAVLDIEPSCPEEVVDQLLRLFTGNTAQPAPPATYAELSSSGRGYHLLLPLPANFHQIPGVAHRIKLRHPQGWFEVLLYHWITFTRQQIPPERLARAAANPAGDGLTWEGLFAQLVQIAPGGKTPTGISVELTAAAEAVENDLDEVEFAALEMVLRGHRENYTKELRTDFDSDNSRWEFSVMIDLALRCTAALPMLIRANGSLTRGPAPAQPAPERILAVLYTATCQVLPARDKHDQTRSGLPYLLRRCIDALATVDHTVDE